MGNNPKIPSPCLGWCLVEADQHICKAYTAYCRIVLFYDIWTIYWNVFLWLTIPPSYVIEYLSSSVIRIDVNWFVIKPLHDDETQISIRPDRDMLNAKNVANFKFINNSSIEEPVTKTTNEYQRNQSVSTLPQPSHCRVILILSGQ